ncbi:DUF2778 domain-containing protein [Pantoea cypripedii]|jgi:hypothetical protein|uniref:Tlde1 domain-containing protein n=1 Tax=Pantoea cypripedii TaxID=55209 RepID=A0A6B9G8V7_PANCY|nr:DUF2778 domain-containing protein [Pantoea cypripedii]QGY28576.1 hypothetical protein CUN67_06335 [Pantoea cypripedii]
MAYSCYFILNRREFSTLHCPGIGTFRAFSGQGEGRNNPDMTHVTNIGPLLRGRYFIVERPTGGTLGPIREMFYRDIYSTDRSKWFALYRDDGKIDDWTFTQGIKRGGFRLHPIGPRGLSEGCITLTSQAQFGYLHDRLMAAGAMINIPGSKLKAYGTIKVY